MIMLSQTVLRTALWLSLGIWVGSWAFFAFVVSRIAFQILPGNVAGDLAGSLLWILHFGGAAAALVAAGAAAALGRRGLLVGLPLVLALICIVSEVWLSPEIALVRPSTLGAASTAVTAERFRIYHGLSLGLFMGVHFASMALILLHARLDARECRPRA
jgi:hypothetical protein